MPDAAVRHYYFGHGEVPKGHGGYSLQIWRVISR